MEAGPAGRAQTILILTLAVTGAVANVAGVALFSDAAPYLGFLDLVRSALVGLAMAAGALTLLLVAHDRVVATVMALGSLAAAAPALAIGLQQNFAGWVAIDAVAFALVPVAYWIALAFPEGRLPGRLARLTVCTLLVLAGAVAAVQIAAYDPGRWGWCGCVRNPLALDISSDSYPPVSDALVLLHSGAVALGSVTYVATRLRRRPQGFDLAVALSLMVASVAWLAVDVRTLTSPDHGPAWVAVLRDLALTLLPMVYAIGFLHRRPSRAHVVDLLLAAREENDPARLRELVGRALGDPRVSVLWWDAVAAAYRDQLAHVVHEPPTGATVLPVAAGGRPIALVVSTRLVDADPDIRDSVAEALLLAAENRRLTVELQASLEQVRDSRARILTASDDARRRIERDLHDGAQQLLISTGIKLNLASAQAGGAEDTELAEVLGEASRELNRALAELRQLASGIAPASLVHGNLENALQELALRSHVPTTLRVTGEGEPGEDAASAVYFVVAECLTNVVKHSGANHVAVEVDLGADVVVTVTDDGRGGATLGGAGTGLRGLVDRVEARGGVLVLASDGPGTVVNAKLPAGQGGTDQP